MVSTGTGEKFSYQAGEYIFSDLIAKSTKNRVFSLEIRLRLEPEYTAVAITGTGSSSEPETESYLKILVPVM